MEQQNDLKLRKEFIKAVYCHLAYLTNTQSNVYASQVAKNLSVNAGDTGLILGSGRSPGEGNGNPVQYSCLGNPWTGEPGRPWSTGSQRVKHD